MSVVEDACFEGSVDAVHVVELAVEGRSPISCRAKLLRACSANTDAVWALGILSVLRPQRHRCLFCIGEVDWDTNYVGADCDCLPEGVTCVALPYLLPIPSLSCLISFGAPPPPTLVSLV